jgi:peptide/nickel transport system ATP-binding protein
LSNAVLSVKDLRIHYHIGDLPVRAGDGVSFTLHEHERFGLVGESGSGKSTAAFGILRLIKPPARIEGGQVLLDGIDLVGLSEAEMNRVRLAQIALIPQGAMNSLNPVMRIRDQLLDGIRTHEKQTNQQELNQRIGDLLEMVGLRRSVMGMYPPQRLSQPSCGRIHRRPAPTLLQAHGR